MRFGALIRRSLRLRGLRLVLAGALAACSLGAAETLPVTELSERLQRAFELGDAAGLRTLAEPYRQLAAVPAELPPETCLLLGIALQQSAPAQACTFFEAAQRSPAHYARASLWLGETFIQLDDLPRARRIAAELERSSPKSAAAACLRARFALHAFERTPSGDLDARNRLADEYDRERVRCFQAHRAAPATFDPRFLVLEIDWGFANNDYRHVADRSLELAGYRPDNRPLLRRVLALHVTELSDRYKHLLAQARKKFSDDEAARWDERAKRYAAASGDDGEPTAYLALATEALSDSPGAADLAPAGFHLAHRAALTLDKKDPRLPEAVARLVQLATRQNYPPAARSALFLADVCSDHWPAFKLAPLDEMRLCYIGRESVRGAVLIERAFPQNQDNYDWIRSAWRMIEEGSSREFRRTAAKKLFELKPDDGFAQLVYAREHIDSPDAGEVLRSFFTTKAPGRHTRAGDWRLFREASEAALERRSFLDGSPTANAGKEFDTILDRWHAALPHDAVVAEQVALRAIRHAVAEKSRAAIEQALAATTNAIDLGSTDKAVVESHPALQRTVENNRITDAAAVLRAQNENNPNARVRAANDADAARLEQLRKRNELLEARIKYLRRLRSEQAELQRVADDPESSGIEKTRAHKQWEENNRILFNLCGSCRGLGVSNIPPDLPTCTLCGGSGKSSGRNSTGPDAGFR